MKKYRNPELSKITFREEPRWATVTAFFEQLRGEKSTEKAQSTLDRIGWAITTLDRADALVTTAAVGKLCVDTWGGPQAQSIANDRGGYAKLITLAKAAQALRSERKRPNSEKEDLLSRISDPMARAEVQLLVAELQSLKNQVSTLRAGMRRVEALGPITAALAQHKIESLEQLAELLKEAKRPTGINFTAGEQDAIRKFIEAFDAEGFCVNEATGELFGRSGRRLARVGFVHALRRAVGLPERSG
ncbi:gamma-mobile-trio protein GmtX [Paraburkholderia oxyphila]|uniref:gamma-mobile-trio protein GmtX n=1 Tax=Paraburkholderia oxyphila TaxID=614212 RepID=UPI0012EDD91E|nr:gamma-mobile-trio protein GmtX [Paraburkholderia oxyphila]